MRPCPRGRGMSPATPVDELCDHPCLAEAVGALRAGGLVILPTETVYGLAADAGNARAVAAVYAAKGRPAFNPLIAHVADLAAARRIARFDARAERLAAAFWPGPLTLVLPKQPNCGVSDLALAGLDSVAVRVPNHPVARSLLDRLGRPVVAPSANRSGRRMCPAHCRRRAVVRCQALTHSR